MNKREMIKAFNNEFTLEYIDFNKEQYLKNKYEELFNSIKKTKDYIKNKNYCNFIYNYNNIDEYVKYKNKKFIEKELFESRMLFNNINGFSLDEFQRKAIITDEVSNLVIAGAGSGKTLTMIGKVKYLIERQNVKEEEILCISFTNETVKSLQSKINKDYNVDIYTFHKLALNIIKTINKNVNISLESYLKYIIDEYFLIIKDFEIVQKYILVYFDEYTGKKRINKSYCNLIKSRKFGSFKKLIQKFILLLKSNNYTINDIDIFLNRNVKEFKLEKQYKNKIFLKLVFNIFKIYNAELLSTMSVDFDDMINQASEIIKDRKVNLKYKYIIIDEYQDISFTRFNLILNMIKCFKCKLIAVGDDYQSIYRFTGCDINLFLDIEKYFERVSILKIQNTYRNSQELIDTAENFITRNPFQIKKHLVSMKSVRKPIKVIFNNNLKSTFEKIILYIYNKHLAPILILGRNNDDIYEFMDNTKFIINSDGTIIYIKNQHMKLKYLTVHKSKGLEEEVVVVINMKNELLGFPNKIEDDKVLSLINKKSKYLYDEERRLFYVALTRTKSLVYLLASKNNISIFLKEILKDDNVDILKFNNI